MISSGDIRTRFSLTKNLISDQTWANINTKINVTNCIFDVTEGLGRAASESTAVLVCAGGFNDQRITADMKYVSPTATSASEIGVIARCNTLDNIGTSESYYYARVDNDVAKLTKVVAGAFTTMTSTAFPLAQNVVVTISLSCVGSAISATFTSAADPGNPVTLSTTDTSIPSGGLMGFRSLSSSVWFRSFTAEEL